MKSNRNRIVYGFLLVAITFAGCRVEEGAGGVGFTRYGEEDDVIYFPSETGPVEVHEFDAENVTSDEKP